jgi:hypothetical protein
LILIGTTNSPRYPHRYLAPPTKSTEPSAVNGVKSSRADDGPKTGLVHIPETGWKPVSLPSFRECPYSAHRGTEPGWTAPQSSPVICPRAIRARHLRRTTTHSRRRSRYPSNSSGSKEHHRGSLPSRCLRLQALRRRVQRAKANAEQGFPASRRKSGGSCVPPADVQRCRPRTQYEPPPTTTRPC